MLEALFLGLTLATAPTSQPSRVELSLGGNVGYTNISVSPDAVNDLAPTGVADHSVGGTAGLSLTVFLLRPVFDDGAPFALQPYLQRASTLQLSAGGGGFSRVDAYDAPLRRDLNGFAHVAADIFIGPHVALTSSFAFSYDRITDTDQDGLSSTSQEFVLPASVGAGYRFKDLRFDLSYRFTPVVIDGAVQPLRWGQVLFTGRAVIHQKLDLVGRVESVASGAFAFVSAAFYPNRHLGVFAGIGGGHGDFNVDTSLIEDRVFGDAGASYWLSRRFGASVAYAPVWRNSYLSSQVDHQVVLNLFSRLK